jgi:uncharacterized membrane-anchored protein
MKRIGQKHIATLLGVAAVAAAMGAAPAAAAAPTDAQQPNQPQQSCTQQAASQYTCEGPGNVQLNDPPSANNYYSRLG